MSDSVATMAQVLQDFLSETLEVLRETVRNMIDAGHQGWHGRVCDG